MTIASSFGLAAIDSKAFAILPSLIAGPPIGLTVPGRGGNQLACDLDEFASCLVDPREFVRIWQVNGKLTFANIVLPYDEVMTETLSIKVPKAQKVRLKALASRRRTTITRLMLQALENLSRESESVAPVSCFELSRDLFQKPENLGASKEG